MQMELILWVHVIAIAMRQDAYLENSSFNMDTKPS